ncbi:Unknown protein sequence [Pseudomonas syringae pv. maculicola]|nr:Unknown protein sequence [Pseudomonas syringae pv. maculicola]
MPSWLKSTSKTLWCEYDYRADAPRGHAVLDAPRHTAVLRCQLDMFTTQGTFSPLGDIL